MPPGSITFGAPWLAWGLLGATIPILVHLLLRRRPRPIVFPAARLLATYQAAEVRAQRLRYLVLLSLRVLIIVLIVLLLMRTACGPDGGTAQARGHRPGEPVSAVLCFDDSASMACRRRGDTRLRHAAGIARALLADDRRFPRGSEAAVVTNAPAAESDPPTADLASVHRRLDALRTGYHDAPVANALVRAYLMLPGARNQHKVVYLFTDLAAPAWQGELPQPPVDLGAVHIVDVGDGETDNVSLSRPLPPDHPIPVDTPFKLLVKVRAGHRPANPSIDVTIDRRPRGRQSVGRVEAMRERDVEVEIPGLARGLHDLTLTLEPPDGLAADNPRYAWLNVAPRDRVVIVADDPPGETAVMLEAMVAPAALDPLQQRFEVRRVTPKALTRSLMNNVRAVIVADVAELPPDVRERLESYANAEGLVLAFPGPRTEAGSWSDADAFWPAPIVSVETCTDPVTVAAANLSHPWLSPFADTEVDTINSRLVYRRLRLGAPPSEATVVAPFNDGRPAIVTRATGRGRIVLFAFSPARQWSQLGSQAGPMIVLLQSLLADPTRRSVRVESLTAGRPESRWFGDGTPEDLQLTLAGEKTSLRLPVRGGTARLPTDSPGAYLVTGPDRTQPPLMYYSVNVAESESDPTRTSEESVVSRFPPGLASVLGVDPEQPGIRASAAQAVSWEIPAILILLAILAIETSFANRFYSFLKW